MKLLICIDCEDVIRLQDEPRTCKCGKAGGKYLIDRINAVYFGETAVPIGFANGSLLNAISKQPYFGLGEIFSAFVIPTTCPTFKRVLKSEIID